VVAATEVVSKKTEMAKEGEREKEETLEEKRRVFLFLFDFFARRVRCFFFSFFVFWFDYRQSDQKDCE